MKNIITTIIMAVFLATGAAFAADVDLTVGGTGAIPTTGLHVAKVHKQVDFSSQNINTVDDYQIVNIPAGTYVLGVSAQVNTAVGSTCTLDIGDSAGATQFLSNFNANGDVGSISGGAYTTQKFYTAANAVEISPDHNATAGVVDVWVYMMK